MAGPRLFRADDLGLVEGLPGRQLASVVAGMTFLAVLAGAGTLAASTLAQGWRQAAGQAAIVQVPRPAEQASGPRPAEQAGGPRPAEQASGPRPAEQAGGPGPAEQASGPRPAAQAGGPRPAAQAGGPRPAEQASGPRPAERAAALRPVEQAGVFRPAEQAGASSPAEQAGGVTREAAVAGLLGSAARLLSQAEVEARLRPWLGEDAGRLGAGLPAVFVLQAALPAGTEARLDQAAPGTLLSRGATWQVYLFGLARSLVACFWLVLAVVGSVAAAVVAIATRAGLAARRDTAEIVHGMGATDGMLAGRLAGRVGLLALAGGAAGALAAVPLLLALARLTAPFHPGLAKGGLAGLSGQATPLGTWASLPPRLWLLLAALPLVASAIGWTTAQASVRTWLRRLP